MKKKKHDSIPNLDNAKFLEKSCSDKFYKDTAGGLYKTTDDDRAICGEGGYLPINECKNINLYYNYNKEDQSPVYYSKDSVSGFTENTSSGNVCGSGYYRNNSLCSPGNFQTSSTGLTQITGDNNFSNIWRNNNYVIFKYEDGICGQGYYNKNRKCISQQDSNDGNHQFNKSKIRCEGNSACIDLSDTTSSHNCELHGCPCGMDKDYTNYSGISCGVNDDDLYFRQGYLTSDMITADSVNISSADFLSEEANGPCGNGVYKCNQFSNTCAYPEMDILNDNTDRIDTREVVQSLTNSQNLGTFTTSSDCFNAADMYLQSKQYRPAVRYNRNTQQCDIIYNPYCVSEQSWDNGITYDISYYGYDDSTNWNKRHIYQGGRLNHNTSSYPLTDGYGVINNKKISISDNISHMFSSGNTRFFNTIDQAIEYCFYDLESDYDFCMLQKSTVNYYGTQLYLVTRYALKSASSITWPDTWSASGSSASSNIELANPSTSSRYLENDNDYITFERSGWWSGKDSSIQSDLEKEIASNTTGWISSKRCSIKGTEYGRISKTQCEKICDGLESSCKGASYGGGKCYIRQWGSCELTDDYAYKLYKRDGKSLEHSSLKGPSWSKKCSGFGSYSLKIPPSGCEALCKMTPDCLGISYTGYGSDATCQVKTGYGNDRCRCQNKDDWRMKWPSTLDTNACSSSEERYKPDIKENYEDLNIEYFNGAADCLESNLTYLNLDCTQRNFNLITSYADDIEDLKQYSLEPRDSTSPNFVDKLSEKIFDKIIDKIFTKSNNVSDPKLNQINNELNNHATKQKTFYQQCDAMLPNRSKIYLYSDLSSPTISDNNITVTGDLAANWFADGKMFAIVKINSNGDHEILPERYIRDNNRRLKNVIVDTINQSNLNGSETKYFIEYESGCHEFNTTSCSGISKCFVNDEDNTCDYKSVENPYRFRCNQLKSGYRACGTDFDGISLRDGYNDCWVRATEDGQLPYKGLNCPDKSERDAVRNSWCNGQGTWNYATNKCNCNSGWGGDLCQHFIYAKDSICSVRNQTFFNAHRGETAAAPDCTCYSRWHGAQCYHRDTDIPTLSRVEVGNTSVSDLCNYSNVFLNAKGWRPHFPANTYNHHTDKYIPTARQVTNHLNTMCEGDNSEQCFLTNFNCKNMDPQGSEKYPEIRGSFNQINMNDIVDTDPNSKFEEIDEKVCNKDFDPSFPTDWSSATKFKTPTTWANNSHYDFESQQCVCSSYNTGDYCETIKQVPSDDIGERICNNQGTWNETTQRCDCDTFTDTTRDGDGTYGRKNTGKYCQYNPGKINRELCNNAGEFVPTNGDWDNFDGSGGSCVCDDPSNNHPQCLWDFVMCGGTKEEPHGKYTGPGLIKDLSKRTEDEWQFCECNDDYIFGNVNKEYGIFNKSKDYTIKDNKYCTKPNNTLGFVDVVETLDSDNEEDCYNKLVEGGFTYGSYNKTNKRCYLTDRSTCDEGTHNDWKIIQQGRAPRGACIYKTDDINSLCNGHGTWNIKNNMCDCDAGYSGTFCNLDEDVLNTQLCFDNGTWNNNTQSCVCNPGYSGNNYTDEGTDSDLYKYLSDRCYFNNDEFNNDICNNQGTWNNENQLCDCNNGFSGKYCHIDQTKLNNFLCSGNGTFNTETQQCDCNPGYNGKSCEFECSGHGTWNESENKCECNQFYKGNLCENKFDKDKLCGGHKGTFNTETQGCNCNPGFSGKYCQYNTSESIDDICVNGTFNTNTQECDCESGYIGVKCDIDENQLNDDSCSDYTVNRYFIDQNNNTENKVVQSTHNTFATNLINYNKVINDLSSKEKYKEDFSLDLITLPNDITLNDSNCKAPFIYNDTNNTCECGVNINNDNFDQKKCRCKNNSIDGHWIWSNSEQECVCAKGYYGQKCLQEDCQQSYRDSNCQQDGNKCDDKCDLKCKTTGCSRLISPVLSSNNEDLITQESNCTKGTFVEGDELCVDEDGHWINLKSSSMDKNAKCSDYGKTINIKNGICVDNYTFKILNKERKACEDNIRNTWYTKNDSANHCQLRPGICIHGISRGDITNFDKVICNNNGTFNPSENECECDNEFEGKYCHISKQTNQIGEDTAQACSGNGNWDASENECDCKMGYYGDQCQNELINLPCGFNGSNPETICNNNGACKPVTGQCKCDQGWSGTYCTFEDNVEKTSGKWCNKKTSNSNKMNDTSDQSTCICNNPGNKQYENKFYWDNIQKKCKSNDSLISEDDLKIYDNKFTCLNKNCIKMILPDKYKCNVGDDVDIEDGATCNCDNNTESITDKIGCYNDNTYCSGNGIIGKTSPITGNNEECELRSPINNNFTTINITTEELNTDYNISDDHCNSKYLCKCPDGFTGKYCNKCKKDGFDPFKSCKICKDNKRGSNCEDCALGYSGNNCDICNDNLISTCDKGCVNIDCGFVETCSKLINESDCNSSNKCEWNETDGTCDSRAAFGCTQTRCDSIKDQQVCDSKETICKWENNQCKPLRSSVTFPDCQCKLGWDPIENCKKCIEGRYGDNCEKVSKCINGIKDNDPESDGQCLSCNEGWRGKYCNIECKNCEKTTQ